MSTYHTISPLSLSPEPVSALAFDPFSDTLWSGSESGIISCYNGIEPSNVRYPLVSNPLPPAGIKRILVTDREIRSFSSAGVGGRSRGGISRWFYRCEPHLWSMLPLSAFANHPTSSTGALLATASAVQELSLPAETISRQIPTTAPVTQMRTSSSGLLVTGATDGYLRTYDVRHPRGHVYSSADVKAHNGAVHCLETSGNFTFSVGLNMRQGRPYPEPLVKLYDLRNLRPLSPIPFSAPAFLNVNPNRPTMLFVTSSTGLIHNVDIGNPNDSGEFYQLDIASYLTASAISSNGTYVGFGDAEGLVHLITSTANDERVPFNGPNGVPGEAPDATEPLPEIHWDNSTPLNMVGMPYYNTPLLSRLTTTFAPEFESFYPPPKIPVQVLSSMKIVDFVGWASLPRDLRGRRNVVAKKDDIKQGKFKSERARRGGADIPKHYRRVDIEYSHFGVEDFDFERYNRTPYSGLETHILNCYSNALLQMLFFSDCIRKVALSHIASPCPREQCLLCEVGFLCKNLDDAKGVNCHSGNFCKSLSTFPQGQSNALGLVESDYQDNTTDYGTLIQTFQRFLLDQMAVESDKKPDKNPALCKDLRGEPLTTPSISQLTGLNTTTVATCMQCRATSTKEGVSHAIDLVYPRKGLSTEPSPANDFESILSSSLSRNMTYKATCPTCRNVTISGSRRVLRGRSLPPILAINAAAQSADNAAYWADGRKGERFLTSTVTAKMESILEEGGDVIQVEVEYELRGIIVQVKSDKETSHLVALMKVPDSQAREPTESPWYIFNDFCVHNIPESDALGFPGPWKVPTILWFERIDTDAVVDLSTLPMNVDAHILTEDICLSWHRDPKKIMHEIFTWNEIPTPGTLVAIDTEFVQMQKEEVEARSDQFRKVLRPNQFALARVSVVRGDGPKEGVPFIDDYVQVSESVYDYVTQFSGIEPGDLDPSVSKHTVVPLKTVYQKIRLLVDLGCIFVGHGLAQDWRIINMFVPPDQVIDTVSLYHLRKRARKISLRFLAWFLLKGNIQTGNHDSIEDARTALMLYKAYMVMEGEGKFDELLDRLATEGRELVCHKGSVFVDTADVISRTSKCLKKLQPLP
ncbi:hypothetical protein DACRYDRAFT_46547 [Dacryopinax primogenitus]|uniref:PAN2-PAN3 deadenylation complex catalytic subunit PAN2 n=1 Tax=Dacryopinax primogenitus (strain DJM 731) TaxID=1858805 RepID=M5GAA6_DACPD|nr:uncharacterized protein DACRYDRAFT_46547 [Dacryopinax primogenitus]EJU05749.1 hypothetical protein DACRYDRAFT_46547 [Dacryopinax primogenitus]